MTKFRTYPQKPIEWRLAIQAGLGLDKAEGERLYQEDRFPYERLEHWIRETFREGFVDDFVPALLRNIQGLVKWVYGDGSEPDWRKSDEENLYLYKNK